MTPSDISLPNTATRQAAPILPHTCTAPLDDAALHCRLQAAITLIREAGEIARTAFHALTPQQIGFKGPQDFLTAADLAVEHHLRQRLGAQFPEDSLFGEELGGEPGSDCWIMDPIDGTANFARGIAHFCCVLAFVSGGKTRFGLIFDPLHDELFVAVRGGGATCNGQPLQVAPTQHFAAANLELGWNQRRPTHDYLQTLAGLLALGANVRRGASGALALAYVACGRSDGYLELHMQPWDCLAGLLLVREAGGQTLEWPSGSWPQGGPVLAATPSLAAAMAQAAALTLSPTFATRTAV